MTIFVAVLMASASGMVLAKATSMGHGRTKVILQNPEATILNPMDGEMCRPIDSSLLLVGSGTDFEDGELTGDSLEWSSNVDGFLGSGEQVHLPPFTLTAGVHVITLKAHDSDGNLGQDQVTVCISDDVFTNGFE